MIENAVFFILGFVSSFGSLLIGFSLGRFDTPLHPALKKRIQEIMEKKVLPSSGVGVVQRPDQAQLDRLNNPRLAEEEELMRQEFERLNTK